MKLVKNPCLRLTALCCRHASSSSTPAAATGFDCDGGVGTRSEVKRQKPSSNDSLRHYNYRLRSLLGSTSPDHLSAALSILRGMLSADSTSRPDAATRSIVFSGLAKRSQPLNEESLALLVEMAKMGFFPHDAILFAQFINKLCRVGATSGAWDFFHAVKDAGGSIEAPVCDALLTGLAAIRDFARMNLLFSEMKGMGVRPSVVTFGILMNHLCKSRRLDDALNVLDAMSSPDLGVAPNTIIFSILIDGLCKAGRLQDGLFLLDRMKSSHACDPNTVTYNSLIDAFCKAAKLGMAHELLTRMEKERVAVDVVTLNSFVNGMCKHGMIGSALDFFRKKKVEWPEVKGDAITYNILIGAFLHSNNVGTATALFDEMIKEGVTVDVVTLNTFVNGMCRHGMIGSALDFFREKKVEWPEVKGNAITYTILIGAFLDSNNVGRATALFDEMIKEGISPDSTTYFTLFYGLTDIGKLDDAYSIVSLMRKNGFRVDIKIYNTLISGFCKKKRLDKAFEIHDEMCKAGIKPDTFTYNTLIDAFCKAGDFSKADKFLNEMVDDGCKPDAVTYGTLINGYCKAGDLDQAMKIFRSMDVSVVPANTVIYSILIDSYCKNQKVDAAIDLFEEMREQDILPNVMTYTSIFKGLKDHNMSDKAFELMDEMSSQRCKPDHVTMLVLTGWLIAIGETERLRLFVQRTTSSDIDSGNPDV